MYSKCWTFVLLGQASKCSLRPWTRLSPWAPIGITGVCLPRYLIVLSCLAYNLFSDLRQREGDNQAVHREGWTTVCEPCAGRLVHPSSMMHHGYMGAIASKCWNKFPGFKWSLSRLHQLWLATTSACPGVMVLSEKLRFFGIIYQKRDF